MHILGRVENYDQLVELRCFGDVEGGRLYKRDVVCQRWEVGNPEIGGINGV